MPRFLDTLTGNFVWTDNPQTVVYAILSHTWRSVEEGGEQSYQDVRRLQDQVEATEAPSFTQSAAEPDGATGPTIFSHTKLSDKIKRACEVARNAGYRLIWNDACCIDKSSSAELTEAINSMFELYKNADICYTFLADVPDGDIPSDISSQFRSSRWHTRGWTLQELIAPKRMVFLTKTWRILGTKIGLASILEDCTGVDFAILTGKVAPSSVSAARRMSWASGRQTTRVEDRAYSLMGLFGVHMPTIYGEGANAFIRLQEEIIRTIPDQSIFAWGSYRTLLVLDQGPPVIHSSPKYGHGLLANSPSDFCNSGDVRPLRSAYFASRLSRKEADVPRPQSVLTPQGVNIVLLCIDIKKVPHILSGWPPPDRRLPPGSTFPTKPLCMGCVRLGPAHLLALLQCEDKDGFLIALPLCQPQWKGGIASHSDSLTVTTHVECNDYRHDAATQPVRTVRLSKETLAQVLRQFSKGPEPTTVSILRCIPDTVPTCPPQGDGAASTRFREQLWETDPVRVDFQIAPRCREELGTLGLVLSPLRCDRARRKIVLSTSLTPDRQHHIWHGRQPQSIQLSLSLIGSALAQVSSDSSRPGTATFSAASEICIITDLIEQDTDRRSYGESNIHFTLRHFPPGEAVGTSHSPTIHPTASKAYIHRDLAYGASLTDRVLADAEFVVFWRRADEDLDTAPPVPSTLDCRLLRFTLEFPSDRSEVCDYRNLWIAIEVSDTISPLRYSRGSSPIYKSQTVRDPTDQRLEGNPLSCMLTVHV